MDRTAEILLRRRRLVLPALLPPGEAAIPPRRYFRKPRGSRWIAGPDLALGVQVLETELLQHGFLMSAALRAEFGRMTATGLGLAGRGLLHALRKEAGDHVEHVPLFRHFPESVPADTAELYVRRVFTVLLQEPEQPCALCGRKDTVHAVSPCAHLVCHACWDGSDYAGCPICHRRIDPDDPFLRPADVPAARTATAATAAPDAAVTRRPLGLLSFRDDVAAAAREVAVSLLERRTPLSAADREDVTVLVGDHLPEAAGWLPESIPVRETRAAVLATLLPRLSPAAARDLLDLHADTATDVLRLLYALMGGDPGLRTRPPRRVSLPRPVRRVLLARLDSLPLRYLVEDLRRHPEAWKHMAETLHPHEFHRRHPTAALAFAALRGTPLTGAFGRAMLEHAAGHPDVLRVDGGRLRAETFASRVEAALRAGEPALPLLAARPGELVRRLFKLLSSGEKGVAEATAAAAPRVAPGVLIAALGRLRTPVGGARAFLPRGDTARAWVRPDDRPQLPEDEVVPVVAALTGEMLRRAGALPPLGRVLLDEGLADLVAPTSERSASGSLVRIPRGSVQPLPGGDRIRLFLHWAEPPGERIDLDLSVILYDTHWQYVGHCDYTNLRLGGAAAVHSGDLTSAPEPLGASEFVDLDLAALRALGGRYATPIVFSYNDVPFDDLVRGFAGFMNRPEGLFDPRAVEQRFDLTGSDKIRSPLVADLWSRTMRWIDLGQASEGYGHDALGYGSHLARMYAAIEDSYLRAGHVTLWEVACWHAAARAGEVLVRRLDGSVSRYARRAGEDVAGLVTRLMKHDHDGPRQEPVGDVDLAVLVHADLDLPEGSRLYALYPWSADASRVELLDAADLVGALAPDTSG
ncbi:MXAN_6230/SCO0854 family RING domain-containing protein [Streptosporangium sp. NPDC023963]|uniref:MXAN_6230/SCO0854 family RING domain-containing protein n=1 Tax=Streptosporangium sp. NPDC023963 TaxID=3155608 RepID=UPI00341372A3